MRILSTDCYMLLLDIYDVAGGTVVHALARETVNCTHCYWWDFYSCFGCTI